MRELARAALPRPVFDFADGGAEDERTLRRNESAFDEVELLPRPSTVPASGTFPSICSDIGCRCR
jgi:isopentenyl diphosphate isomerase/L-lactate dehydrogenase-like FMN-dependent dehydrogenase